MSKLRSDTTYKTDTPAVRSGTVFTGEPQFASSVNVYFMH